MPSPSEFFAAARARFDEAAAKAPDGHVDFRLAGHRVRLRFAGTAMRPLVEPVFRHLPRFPPDTLDLTIDLWDARTTGVRLPPRPWGETDVGARGLVLRYCDQRFATRLDAQSATVSMIDGGSGHAFECVPDTRRLPHWERAHPLSTVLGHWFRGQGLTMVHAAAIGRPAGGALIAGRGGSGKSTCVLACIAAGLRTAGDDYLLVDGDGTAHSLFGSATLQAGHRRRFPQLMPQAEAPTLDDETEKHVTLLAVDRPAAMIAALPLVAIVVPRIVGSGPCRLHPISPASALRALAPSTLLQLGQAPDVTLARLAALCRRLPCHGLDLGPEPAEIPATIGTILDRGAGQAAGGAVG